MHRLWGLVKRLYFLKLVLHIIFVRVACPVTPCVRACHPITVSPQRCIALMLACENHRRVSPCLTREKSRGPRPGCGRPDVPQIQHDAANHCGHYGPNEAVNQDD